VLAQREGLNLPIEVSTAGHQVLQPYLITTQHLDGNLFLPVKAKNSVEHIKPTALRFHSQVFKKSWTLPAGVPL
jgi:hypothetical protein